MTETQDYLENGNGNGEVDGIGGMDFNVDAEYKPEPLIPNGSYSASVTSVKFDAEKFCLIWGVVLQDNGRYASDGETPVDGMQVFFRNWLPKPGDEQEYSKNGRTTKRQSKINMLKKFADGMKIDIGTPQKIAEAIQYQTWVGADVKIDVQVSEYKGEVRNEVNKMMAA
jgi:hypothetical protein